MVGGEGDAVVEQKLQTALERRVDRAHARPPEEAVVDDQELGAGVGRAFEGLRVGGYRRDEPARLCRARDLQAVDAVVLEALRAEEGVRLGEDLGDSCGHGATIAVAGSGQDAGRA